MLNEETKKLTIDEENAIKWNLKKEKIKQDKKNKKIAYQKILLNPIIKNNVIVWVDRYKNRLLYEGFYGKEKCFEIERGFFYFKLKIVHKEINEIKGSNINSFVELFKAQKKANDIICANPNFLLKFKPIS